MLAGEVTGSLMQPKCISFFLHTVVFLHGFIVVFVAFWLIFCIFSLTNLGLSFSSF